MFESDLVRGSSREMISLVIKLNKAMSNEQLNTKRLHCRDVIISNIHNRKRIFLINIF